MPGLLGVILQMTMVMMTSMALTRETERGTMESLLAMPATASEVMVSKILPYLAVGAVQVTVVLLAARGLFAVPFLGRLDVLIAAVFVFVLALVLLGYAISSFARTQMQAMQLTFFFFLPSIMLSGFMFPFRGMPGWAQVLGELFPLTHFIRAIRAVMLKGADLGTISREMLDPRRLRRRLRARRARPVPPDAGLTGSLPLVSPPGARGRRSRPVRAPAIRSETPLAAPHAARTGSAGRLQAMADASARVRQLAGLAALARARVPGAAPIQRRRIHEGLTSFLSGAAPDEARLRAYVDRYEIAGMAQMARDYCTDDTLAKAVPTAFAAMRTTTLAAKGGTGTWTAAATALETLVAAINAAFAQSKAPSGYEASDKANWGGVDAAVKGAEAAVATGTPGRKPERKGAPEIRTIAFSSAKSTFPPRSGACFATSTAAGGRAASSTSATTTSGRTGR